jgi:tetratricopeptide (TPR) repeat protein
VSSLRRALPVLLSALVAAALPGRAAETPAGDFDALVAQAEAARGAGQLEAAVEGFGRALGQRPEWTEGHWILATLLYDLDRYQEAHGHFTAFVDQKPDDALALALKGLCESRLGNHERALADLRRAIALGVPHTAVESAALLQAALLTNKLGDPDQALDLLRPFAASSEDPLPVIQAFGLVLLRLPLMPGEVAEEKRDMILLAGRGGYHMARSRRNAIAQLALEELASRYPAEPNVHYALGVYLQPEEPDRAAREFRRELELSPDNHVAMLQLASMELRRGNTEVALEMSERGMELAPESPAAHLMLGRSLLESGEAARAVEILEAGTALAPESPDFAFALGRAYRRAGRGDDAARADERFRLLMQARQQRAAEPGGPS